jgi:hypothetical protein
MVRWFNAKRTSFMNALKYISVLLALAMVLSACSTDAMTDVAKQFAEATFEGDKDTAVNLACDAYKKRVESEVLQFSQAVNGATIDLSGLTYTAGEQTGNTGTVIIGGTITIITPENTSQFELTRSLPMKNEGGWTACDP